MAMYELELNDNQAAKLIWRWNGRQSAWHCVTHNSGAEAYTQWSTLVSQYSPVTLYAEIPG